MITIQQVPEVVGRTAYDRNHRKIGEVAQVFADDATGRPEWMTVRTGRFGAKESFVPVEPVEVRGDEVVIPFTRDEVRDAPMVAVEEDHLSLDDEQRLYDHYGLQYRPVTEYEAGTYEAGTAKAATAEAGAVEAEMAEPKAARNKMAEPGVAQARTAEPMAAGAGTAEVEEAEYPVEYSEPETMTRSEEHLQVGTEERETGRARLRKYVTTEYEQTSVPLRRERVRVERVPITEEERQHARDEDFVESEREMILHEDRPVVGRETVPVERVRMDKETVTADETVAGDVRREHVVAEEDIERSARAAASEDEQYEPDERYEP